MKKTKFSFGIVIVVLLFFAGAALFLYPYVTKFQSDILSKNAISEFELQYKENKSAALSKLYKAAMEYNEEIFTNNQAGLKDQDSYQKSLFNLSDYGIDTDVFGYIDIPKIGEKLPIYLGASKKNMALGAVHLTYTSLPLEQDNTNCVIAAHRGYRGAAFFKKINELEPGDIITVHTPWNILTYTVTETKIIKKNDIGQVYIQKGKKLLTLSSCHPYTKNTHRYLVFAELTNCTDK